MDRRPYDIWLPVIGSIVEPYGIRRNCYGRLAAVANDAQPVRLIGCGDLPNDQ